MCRDVPSLVSCFLVSMADSFERTPTVCIRMSNRALTFLAGNVEPHHRVGVETESGHKRVLGFSFREDYRFQHNTPGGRHIR